MESWFFEQPKASGKAAGPQFHKIGEGIEGWVAYHGEPVAILDASQERRFRDLPGRRRRVRGLAVVPMKLRDDVVGVLATAGVELVPPAGSRLTGLEILAGIAAVAIENDRLLYQERQRVRQSETLLKLAGIKDLELFSFIQTVADAINSSLKVDDTELVLLDERGEHVVCVGRPGNCGPGRIYDEKETSALLSSSWITEVLDTGQPLICDDVAANPRLSREFEEAGREVSSLFQFWLQGRNGNPSSRNRTNGKFWIRGPRLSLAHRCPGWFVRRESRSSLAAA